MRHSWPVLFPLLCLLALLLLGCGGGGSPSPGGGVSISLTPTSATVGPNGQVDFVATVTGSANQEVSWSAPTGSFNATGVGKATYTASTLSTTVTAASIADPTKFKTASVTVVANQATLKGRVQQNDTAGGISGVVIDFYNIGGTVIGTATTNASGNFTLAIDPSAVTFQLRPASISSGYYKAYKYNVKHYTPLELACRAPIPTLTAGTTTNLATPIVLSRTYEAPPPPPDGC
ncbi:MAG: hypothetical protein HZC36_06005 [Armatimonadetes bacterium]|nr:hypothetical protein [Armatimonadota bacterium]